MSHVTSRLLGTALLASWLGAGDVEADPDPPSPEPAPSTPVEPTAPTESPVPTDTTAADRPAEPTPSAPPTHSSADDDSMLLGGDEATPSKLQIYGFADMTMRRGWFSDPDSIYRLYQRPEASLAMGRINVYIRSEPTPRLSSLLEVRLLYLPNGATAIDPTSGNLDTTNTVVIDDAELGGTLQWGGIAIQRAHLDYRLTDHISLRAGHWLTPYGIWNVDHGSPTVIGVRRPFVINQALFPESQVGLQAIGTTSIGSTDLTWNATLSNGRVGEVTDHDLDKAVGGRLELAFPMLDELRVGASGYFAAEHTYTFQATASDPSDPSTATLIRKNVGTSHQLSLAADLRIRAGRFRLLAEGILAQRTYQGIRPFAVSPRPTGFEPDHLNFGGYVIAGFQTTPLSAMPFLQIENSRGTTQNSSVGIASLGVNLRPVPTLTVKFDVGAGRISPYGHALAPPTNLALVEAQIAWVFR